MSNSIPPAYGHGPSTYYVASGPTSPHTPHYHYAPGSTNPSPGNVHQYYYPQPRVNSRGGGPYSSPRQQNHVPSHPIPPYVPHAPAHIPNQMQSPTYPKLNSNYPPQIPYPHPASSWQTPPPLSPLPKQLSMPPPPLPNVSDASNPVPSPHSSVPHSPLISSLPSPSVTSPMSPSLSTVPIHLSIGRRKKIDPTNTWVIWSRRPQNPMDAPGIIFAHRSNPPPSVIARAMQLPSPPPSPFLSPKVLEIKDSGTPNTDVHNDNQKPLLNEAVSHDLSASAPNSTVPSSSATETTHTPTAPCSPVSSNTSLSVHGTPAKDNAATTPAEGVSNIITDTHPIATSVFDIPPAPESEPTPTPAPTPPSSAQSPPAPKKSWASLLQPGSSASATTSGHLGRNALPTSSVVGFSVPASSSPTLPPNLPAPNDQLQLAPAKRAEILNLLVPSSSHASLPHPPSFAAAASATVNNPAQAASTASATATIRPRGIINTGNMCFANSVLQVLVYCHPFSKLIQALGKSLPPGGLRKPKKEGDRSPAAVVEGHKEEGASLTPLVDATVRFFNEFVPPVVGSSEVGSDGAKKMTMKDMMGSSSRGKGKEKESAFGLLADEENGEDEEIEAFIPTYVYDAIKELSRFENMRSGQQEDAEEFLGFYLDTLEEELLALTNVLSPQRNPTAARAAIEEKEEAPAPHEDGWLEVGKRNRTVVTRTIKSVESPITRIFGGKSRSVLKAPHQKDSATVDDFKCLRLDIQREQVDTIEDALLAFSHPQPVQVSHPTRTGVSIDASLQAQIESLPQVLIIQMKRFCYDTDAKGTMKVRKQVRFEPELEIPRDVTAPTANGQGLAKYKLFGVVYHHGLSASGGHYTLDVLHPHRFPASKIREGWIRVDDDLVSDVRPEDVFEAFDKDMDHSKTAYLLFYKRIR